MARVTVIEQIVRRQAPLQAPKRPPSGPTAGTKTSAVRPQSVCTSLWHQSPIRIYCFRHMHLLKCWIKRLADSPQILYLNDLYKIIADFNVATNTFTYALLVSQGRMRTPITKGGQFRCRFGKNSPW